MGFFDRFRRRPAATLVPDDLPDSPICWQAGDQAVCIATDMWIARLPHLARVPGPQYGDQYTVSRVIILERRQFLGLAGFGGAVYAACYFERPRASRAERGMEALRKLLKTKPATRRVDEPVLIGREDLCSERHLKPPQSSSALPRPSSAWSSGVRRPAAAGW